VIGEVLMLLLGVDTDLFKYNEKYELVKSIELSHLSG
jgi:hypothetical protein